MLKRLAISGVGLFLLATPLLVLILTSPLTAQAQNMTCLRLSNDAPNPDFLSFGDTDENSSGKVTLLQNFLVSAGYLTMPSGVSFGSFRELTRDALQNFQRDQDIVSTGTPEETGFGATGPLTRERIATVSGCTTSGGVNIPFGNANASAPASAPFCHAFNIPSPGEHKLSMGDSGNEVEALNQALSLSGIPFRGESQSYYDATVAANVREFQSRYGFESTGQIGPRTSGQLNALYGCEDNQQTQPTTDTGNTLPSGNTLPPDNTLPPGNTTPATISTTATITSSSVSSSPTPTITGTATGVSSVMVSGGISGATEKLFTVGPISVVNGLWTATVPTPLPSGTYRVYVHSAGGGSPLATGTLSIGTGNGSENQDPTVTGTGGNGTVSVTYANIPVNSYIQLINRATLNIVRDATIFNVIGNSSTPVTINSVPTGSYTLRVRQANILSAPLIAESSPFTVDVAAAEGSVPAISNFYPATITSGVNSTVVINGTGFRQGAVIVYSGASSGELPTNYVSSQQITFGPHLWATAGTYSFQVKNLGGQTSTGERTFTVRAPDTLTTAASAAAATAAGSAITISSFYPTAVTAGVYSNIIITGFNFPVNSEVVYTSASGATGVWPMTRNSEQEITVGPYTWNIGGIGDYTFRVRNKDNVQSQSGVSATFRVLPPVSSTPFITSVSPSTLPSGQTTFTINGSNFQSGATVRYSGNSLGNYSANFTVNSFSATQLGVTATGLAAGSTYALFVRNPGGQTSAGCTTYTSCASALSVSAADTSSTPNTPATVTTPTPSASDITSTSVIGRGTVNPHGVSGTIGWFRSYGTNPGTCSDTSGNRFPATGGISINSSSYLATPFSQTVTGLVPNTTYYYCAIAENSAGKVLGNVVTVTTGSGAAAATVPGAPTNVSATAGNAAATVTFSAPASNGGSAITSYEATCTSTAGSNTAPPSTGSPITVPNLTNGASYLCSVVARNSVGSGAPASAPSVTPVAPASGGTDPSTPNTPATVTTPTPSASDITSTSVIGRGTVNPHGVSGTIGWFRSYGTNPGTCSDTSGNRFPATGGISINSSSYLATPFSQTVTGLVPNTTYYYCAIAENSAGKVLGNVVTVTTNGTSAMNSLSRTSQTASVAEVANNLASVLTALQKVLDELRQ